MTKTDPTPYLFTAEGLAQLHAFIDSETLFAFDLDGTLAPIVAEPCNIQIPESILAQLIILNKWANMAVITGRSRHDALFHLGFVPKYLVGNHGAEGLPEREEQEKNFLRIARTWEDQLQAMLPDASQRGLFIENKGATVSIHYRHCTDGNMIQSRLAGIVGRLTPRPRRIGGKCVENLIPAEAPDKGFAMLHLMRYSGCPRGFFAGDDKTDEIVFELPENNIFTVRVGDESPTKARYVLQNQQEIPRLLREINTVRFARLSGAPVIF